jgi:serine protease Do
VLVSPDGYCLTNAHVVEGSQSIKVLLAVAASTDRKMQSILKARGKIVEAEILGVDKETDLAVLKLQGENELPFLALGDSDEVDQGQVVLAFGSPLGLDNSVTMGIVSSVGRQLRPEDPVVYIQTDAPINPGNSGGPLVNAVGEIVGINTFILSQSGGNEGVGFALPSNIAKHVYQQILEHGRVRRGEVGIAAQTITPELAKALKLRRPWGVVVSDIRPGSPAEEAGIKIGDMILSMDGKTMENGRQFDVNLYRKSVGEMVTMQVQRGLQTLSKPIRVVERFDSTDRFEELVSPEKNLVEELGFLGLNVDRTIAPLSPGSRRSSGVLVVTLSTDAITWGGNLMPGDVIYAINGSVLEDLQGLRLYLSAHPKGEPMAIQVLRRGRLHFVTFEME